MRSEQHMLSDDRQLSFGKQAFRQGPSVAPFFKAPLSTGNNTNHECTPDRVLENRQIQYVVSRIINSTS
jgi:hypothetical protein